MYEVELTILDNVATRLNVEDFALGFRIPFTPYATQPSSSSSLIIGGNSTVIAFVGICDSLPKVKLDTLLD